jgi:hypothetical protein
VDTELERPRWRFTASYRLHERAQLGVEYNPVAGEVNPLATLFLLTETDNRPALFLGTSSDRIGSPEGTQAYYLTASKMMPVVPLGNWFGGPVGVSLIAAWMDTFGIAVHGGF